jgi:hypothetical protein
MIRGSVEPIAFSMDNNVFLLGSDERQHLADRSARAVRPPRWM